MIEIVRVQVIAVRGDLSRLEPAHGVDHSARVATNLVSPDSAAVDGAAEGTSASAASEGVSTAGAATGSDGGDAGAGGSATATALANTGAACTWSMGDPPPRIGLLLDMRSALCAAARASWI